jgi:hypothetical protein
MRKVARLILVVAMVVTSKVASADGNEPEDLPIVRGVQVGAYVGYLVPGGSSGSSVPPYLGQLVSWAAPLGLEAGWRFNRDIYVGATGWFAPGGSSTDDFVCNTQQCTQHVIQMLAEVRFYLGPPIRPGTGATSWVGIGTGWEFVSITRSGDGVSGTTGLDGPVPLRVQIGVGIHAGRLELGPFVELSIGKFVHRTLSPDQPGFQSVPLGGDLHDWFGVGLRGGYRL